MLNQCFCFYQSTFLNLKVSVLLLKSRMLIFFFHRCLSLTEPRTQTDIVYSWECFWFCFGWGGVCVKTQTHSGRFVLAPAALTNPNASCLLPHVRDKGRKSSHFSKRFHRKCGMVLPNGKLIGESAVCVKTHILRIQKGQILLNFVRTANFVLAALHEFFFFRHLAQISNPLTDNGIKGLSGFKKRS